MPDRLPHDEALALAARLLAGRRDIVEHVCPVCGKPFVGLRQRKTCSDACRSALSRQRRRQRRHQPEETDQP